MKINSHNNKEIENFFESHQGLTDRELAILANVSTSTITEWKRKVGLLKPLAKKPLQVKGVLPKDWDNKEWFEKTYESMGLRSMALLLGKDVNFVTKRLKQHGIRIKSLSERTISKNPCCDEGWLYYYYADKNDYSKWCKKNKIEPCEDGGQRLSTIKCAELAGVSPNTITNWLVLFKMRIRSQAEAQLGTQKFVPSAKLKRQSRDNFFKEYRKGTINMIIGNQRFSNGTRVDKTETINNRFNTRIKEKSTSSTS